MLICPCPRIRWQLESNGHTRQRGLLVDLGPQSFPAGSTVAKQISKAQKEELGYRHPNTYKNLRVKQTMVVYMARIKEELVGKRC